MRAIFLRVVFSRVAAGCGDHTAWTSRPTDSFSTYPGSAFAALTAARLPTNLPLVGAIYPGTSEAIAMRVRCMKMEQ
jgi:hypothetical protein